MLQSASDDDPLVGRLLDALFAELSPELRDQVASQLQASGRLPQAWATLVRDAKLAALKQLAYGASHEINNPLANIASRAQSLLLEEADPERRRQLATIYAQAMRGHAMIADLMLFAQPAAPQFAPFDVVTAVAEVIDSLAVAAEAQSTSICFHAPATVTLVADRVQIASAVAAAIQNSLDAISTDGEIIVSIVPQNEGCVIMIADSGPGAPAEVRNQAFDPFYSGREAGRGLGFGLTKCWTIAQSHHGTVTFQNVDKQGAQLCLQIPWNLSTIGHEKAD
ncbi:HAMP domain-containing histidine kinase [Blastopirellula sp. JC732]|uniref:histidine kinase n=1 Tax=Blastopirellula sediminis TaxID=2894196 RepID=A0A9X1SIE0_9BACT|nr:HAMP domain-containing sensor histidine kinase [Blastopirellula sediminis]MCC9605970.1 HAMP domain-containing histidine kinase [Blastopirellula sediminis]MCC9630731.1 HAMP domain-containing histidine kinase [Blastopirellula sediminis]